MFQASQSDMATRSLPPYFAHRVTVKFAHPHPPIILTKHVCHHNSFWRSRSDSNHAPTISLKPVHFHGDFGIPFRLKDPSLIKAHFITNCWSSTIFRVDLAFLSMKSSHFGQSLPKEPFQACNSKYSKNKPKRPDVFNYVNYDTQGIKFQR